MTRETMRYFATAILVANLAVSAAAEEKSKRLKQGAGLDKVESNCNACHSLDYVPMNSPVLNAAGWDAEVAKMINAFGAPIDETDAKIIADYLKKNLWEVTVQARKFDATLRARSVLPVRVLAVVMWRPLSISRNERASTDGRSIS
jgi:hypothetical protein